MDFKLQIKNWLEKLRALPEKNKKIILWAVVAVLAIILGSFWVRSAINRLNEMGNDLGQIQFPEIESPDTN